MKAVTILTSLTPFELIAISLVAFQFLIVLIIYLRFRNRLAGIEGSLKQYQLKFSSDIYAASQGAIGVGKRLLRVEKLLKQNVSEANIIEGLRQELSGFELADSLILRGESASKIVDKTGVSLAEVQLLKLLNESESYRKTA